MLTVAGDFDVGRGAARWSSEHFDDIPARPRADPAVVRRAAAGTRAAARRCPTRTPRCPRWRSAGGCPTRSADLDGYLAVRAARLGAQRRRGVPAAAAAGARRPDWSPTSSAGPGLMGGPLDARDPDAFVSLRCTTRRASTADQVIDAVDEELDQLATDGPGRGRAGPGTWPGARPRCYRDNDRVMYRTRRWPRAELLHGRAELLAELPDRLADGHAGPGARPRRRRCGRTGGPCCRARAGRCRSDRRRGRPPAIAGGGAAADAGAAARAGAAGAAARPPPSGCCRPACGCSRSAGRACRWSSCGCGCRSPGTAPEPSGPRPSCWPRRCSPGPATATGSRSTPSWPPSAPTSASVSTRQRLLIVAGPVLPTGLRALLDVLADVLDRRRVPDARGRAGAGPAGRAAGHRRAPSRRVIARRGAAAHAGSATTRHAGRCPTPDEVAGGDGGAGPGAARDRRWCPRGSILVLVGDLDPARALDTVEVGARPAGPARPSRPRAAAAAAAGAATTGAGWCTGPARCSRSSGSSAAGGAPATTPDYPALQLANLVYGGYFSSRLVENIREDKGYTYGAHSGIESRAGRRGARSSRPTWPPT